MLDKIVGSLLLLIGASVALCFVFPDTARSVMGNVQGFFESFPPADVKRAKVQRMLSSKPAQVGQKFSTDSLKVVVSRVRRAKTLIPSGANDGFLDWIRQGLWSTTALDGSLYAIVSYEIKNTASTPLSVESISLQLYSRDLSTVFQIDQEATKAARGYYKERDDKVINPGTLYKGWLVYQIGEEYISNLAVVVDLGKTMIKVDVVK